jgi:hypothetical protein
VVEHLGRIVAFEDGDPARLPAGLLTAQFEVTGGEDDSRLRSSSRSSR